MSDEKPTFTRLRIFERPEYWKAKLEWEEKDHAQDRARIAELEAELARRVGALRERVRVLEEAIALLTIRTASGQLCFRTSGGIPMGMPKKQERRVEALLSPSAEQEPKR